MSTYSKQPPYQNLPGVSRKRQKIAFACDPCRERKVRCDGGKPVCTSCKRKQYTPGQCIYSSENAKTAKTNEYIGALLHKIHRLESTSRENGFASGPTGDRDLAVQASFREPERHTDDILEAPNDVHSHLSADAVRPETEAPEMQSRSDRDGSFARAYSEHNSPIDAMGTTSAVPEAQTAQGEDFYGASSAVSFLNEIRETLLGHSTQRETPTSRIANSNSRGQNSNLALGPLNRTSTVNFEQLSLPPRTLADHLLICYWSRVHCLYPFVHKQSFQTSYEALWVPESESPGLSSLQNVGLGGSKCRQSVFYCALNTAFALGAQFSDLPLAERDMLSESFFQRSKQLLHFDILDNGDLALVQTFLIVAQYLQSTQSPSRCWNVVGMACRVAEGIGLYLDSGVDQFSILEAEMRRRTWHGCVMLDMVVSMTLGRPTLGPNESDVPLPSAIDDQYLTNTSDCCEQPVEIFSRITFFVQTIKLYQKLGVILANIYRPWSPVASQRKRINEQFKSGTIAMIIEMDTELADWESQLPDNLHWERRELTTVDEVLERQSNVLRARFLHIKILLYRPLFNQVCRKNFAGFGLGCSNIPVCDNGRRDQTDSGLYSSFTLRCAVACVEAAQELISTIDVSSRGTATGAWWYNVFYLYTSAMVLILADSCNMTPANSPSRDHHSSWLQCMETLDRLDNAAGAQCAQSLRNMRQQVFSAKRMQHEQQASISNVPYPNTGPVADGVQSSPPPDASEAQHEIQDFVNIELLLEDEQLRAMLWQDIDMLAPGNIMNDSDW